MSTKEPFHLLKAISETDDVVQNNFHDFKAFIQKIAKEDDTWRFWIQCIFQDLMAYVCLFLSMRGGDWCLRVASIKQMAATFTAFNHPHYAKLISKHLDDLLSIPQSVLTMFQQGAFVISISGRAWHSVWIDESHEMMVNKSCKMAIVRPSKDYINRVIHYLPNRTTMLENVSGQLFPEREKVHKKQSLSPLIMSLITKGNKTLTLKLKPSRSTIC